MNRRRTGRGGRVALVASVVLLANGHYMDTPLAVVEVLAGYVGGGPFMFGVDHPPAEQVRRALGYWTVAGVYRQPCTKAGGLRDAGTTADDLATALAAQRLTTTDPVSIDGHDGLYLELTAQTCVDYDTCKEDDVDIFDSSPGGGRYSATPGMVDRYWILDVDDHRVVLSTAAAPDVTKDQVQELTAMAESVRFVEPS